MFREELIRRSPLRVLDKSIQGGLVKGNMSVITARKGVGKTAFLAHIAIDKMLQKKKVLHISFTDDPHHVESWYRQVFDEITKIYKLENSHDVYNELIRNRMIIHFKQDEITFDRIREHIKQVEGGSNFIPDLMIVDGRDFEQITSENLSGWRTFAKNQNTVIWFSAVLHREHLQLDNRGIPAPVNQFADLFDVIIMLEPHHEYIEMKLLKNYESQNSDKLPLKLDVNTLLISNHRV